MNVIMESLGDPIWQIGGGDHHSGSAGAHTCPAQPRGSSLIVAPMALDPTHAGGMPLTLPCAQCGSGLVSRSECRSHRRACGLVDSSFVFWGAFAFADAVSLVGSFSLSISFADAHSIPDSLNGSGAYYVL